jgi:hypothetical protein
MTPADKRSALRSTVELGQQPVRAPHVRNHDAASYYQRHVDGFLLLGLSTVNSYWPSRDPCTSISAPKGI